MTITSYMARNCASLMVDSSSGGSKTQQQIAKPMASDVEGKEWNSWDVEIFETTQTAETLGG